MKKFKITALSVAVLLLLSAFASPSLAWVMGRSNTVVNTFTYGNIVISLRETDTGLDLDDDPNTNLYEIIIGKDIAKDPVVTVHKDSEKAWLIVSLKAENDFDKYLTYTINDGWQQLTDDDGNPVDGVYYMVTPKTDEDIKYKVIKDDTVKIREGVTKETLREITDLPKLTVTAYAVQHENIDTAYKAWELINPADMTIEITQMESDTQPIT